MRPSILVFNIQKPGGLSRPQKLSSGEVTFATYEPYLGLSKRSRDERIIPLHALCQFLRRIHGWIHFAAKPFRNLLQRGEKIGVGHLAADHHQIDIDRKSVV